MQIKLIIKLSRAHTVIKCPLGLYCQTMNMMIMSHCGISVIINFMYDSQDEFKRVRKKTSPEFYIITRNTSRDCDLRRTRDPNVGYREKYMNGGNTGVLEE